MDKHVVNQLLDEIYRKTGDCSPYKRIYTDKYVNTTCPYHKENNPSFGINFEKEFYKCFSCAAIGSIEKLAQDFNIDLEDEKIESTRNVFAYSEETTGITSIKPDFTFDEFYILQRSKPSSYLLKRGITKEVQNRYGIVEQRGCVYFPCFDYYGNPLFFASRLVNRKIFNIKKGIDKPLYLGWDIENYREPLYICEGPIDALSIRVMNGTSIALFGLGSSSQIETLKTLPNKTFIFAMDNDEAGKKATASLANKLSNSGKILLQIEYDRGLKDPNDILIQSKNKDIKELKIGNCESLLVKKTQPISNSCERRQFIRIS